MDLGAIVFAFLLMFIFFGLAAGFTLICRDAWVSAQFGKKKATPANQKYIV